MSTHEVTIQRYGITVDTERCTGCGACIEACPSGALYLVDGKAAVDNSLCRGCEACLGVCPVEALALVAQTEPAAQPNQRVVRPPDRLPGQPLTRRPQPEPIRVRTESAAIPWRARVLPVFGAAAAWAGREIVPRVVDVVLDAFDRRSTEGQITAWRRSNGARSRRTEGKGHRHRHRRRGGR
jgi:NAD-dependent dihydropyrimidine dehydrogenase PreA subunit